MHDDPPPLQPINAASLALPGIAHAFFTREGGVSTGLYRGLNTGLGSRDLREAVIENRAARPAISERRAKALATPHQVHSAEAVIVEKPWAAGQGPKVDAVVTKVPGVAVGVGAADCGPVLFRRRGSADRGSGACRLEGRVLRHP